MSTRWRWSSAVDTGRRRVVSSLALLGGIVAATGSARAEDKKAEDKTLRFPGDPPENYVVYQFNKPEAEYHDHILYSAGALLRQCCCANMVTT